ncbi:MAG: LysR family transcriptional regulator [Gammaproteobacteria bacterium]|nr:LysR family transcriptional regulator [Gammaproteobacteria bacterium]MCP4984012.1 LysR family transcriptional regulator [Gammaproteobacteria bacterium]
MMNELRHLIHSPHHLFVFEVCGRLMSFTQAAVELGVSQPAVSLAIRQLEKAIGQRLFHREHRSIRLTEAGDCLYAEVSISFERILQTVREINQVPSPALVTLSISTAFANYWVMPRLTRLHQSHPGIDLRLQVVDRDLDLEHEKVSLGIRRGRGNWPGYHSSSIAREELLAVASPVYVASHGLPTSIEDLHQHQFVHLEEPFRRRPTWHDWFQSFDQEFVDRGEGLRLNDYALVIQAAMAGEGVALGWRHVVTGLIRSRLLVPVMPQSWITGEEFHLIWSDRTSLSDSAQRVRDWIIEEARIASLVRLP